MTYDFNDFKTKLVPQRQAISNANGDIYIYIYISGNRGRNNGIINHIHSP